MNVLPIDTLAIDFRAFHKLYTHKAYYQYRKACHLYASETPKGITYNTSELRELMLWQKTINAHTYF